MLNNPKIIKNHFKKSYDKYDFNASVQKLSAKKLVAELIKIKNDFPDILECGCGTGVLTSEIKSNINYKNYFVNDIVAQSKNYIDKILDKYTFICGDAKKIRPKRKFDLIISNAMLQWFEKLEPVFNNFSLIMKKDGILALTTFGTDNYREIKEISGLGLNYKPLEKLIVLLKSDFEILYTEDYKQVLEFNNPLEMLAHMKNTGVNSLSEKPWTFTQVKDFCVKYSQKYPKTVLTYNPIIVICTKK